jgi:transcriptional regulator with XRE-family HTH domain
LSEANRVRELRKALNSTLDKFAEPLGVSKTAISRIENGERSLTDQMAKAICREYSVNEEWLRNGTGEMFAARPIGDDLKAKIDYYLPDEGESFRLRLARMILSMDKEDMERLEAYARKYLFPEEEEDPAIDQKVESYRAELEAEAASEKSKASQTTKDA